MISKIISKYRSMHPAAKAAIWFTICSFMQKAMNIVTIPIFTRLMSTEQYGQFTVYRSWLEILTVLTTLRLNYSVFNKGMSEYKTQRDEYVSTMQTITTGLTVFAFTIYVVFRIQINKVIELPSFILCAIFAELLVMPAIEFWTLKRRYEYSYRDVVICTFFLTLLNLGLGIVAVLCTKEKGYARIISSVLAYLLLGIPLYIYNLRKSSYRFFNKELAIFALRFNLPLIAHFISLYILEQFDKIMIQKMVSFEAAALYGLTSQIGMLLKIFTLSINNALIPWMYDKLERRQFAVIDETIFKLTILVSILSVLLSIVAPEAVLLFATRKYYEAVIVVPPVALGMVFQFLYMVYANIEFYYNKNKAAMFISGGAACINFILNYFGILWYGYAAAAYTTLVCYLLMTIGHFTYMKLSLKKENIYIDFHGKRMLILSIIVVMIGVAVISLYTFPIVRYCLLFIITIAMWIKRKEIKGLLLRK